MKRKQEDRSAAPDSTQTDNESEMPEGDLPEMGHIGADIPKTYVAALDRWCLKQKPPISRAEAVRRIICNALGLAPPKFEKKLGIKLTPDEQAERREEIARLYRQLGSYAAVAREIGISQQAVRLLLKTHFHREQQEADRKGRPAKIPHQI